MPSLEALVPLVFSTPCISARGRAHLRSRVLPRLRVRPRLWVQGSPPTLIRRQDRCSSRGLTQRGRGSESTSTAIGSSQQEVLKGSLLTPRKQSE